MTSSHIVLAIPHFPYKHVSLPDILEGKIGLSGTHGSTILMAVGLARLGYRISVHTVGGNICDNADFSVKAFASEDELISGVIREGPELCIWLYAGTLSGPSYIAQHIRLWMWAHNPVPHSTLKYLGPGQIEQLILVSDTERLRHRIYTEFNRIAYIYNAISPAFTETPTFHAGSKDPLLVFAGHLSEYKGAHRILQTWPAIRRNLPGARLLIVGSQKLYGEDLDVGPRGLASPEFESNYIQAIEDEFGSLNNSGIEFSGLLSPSEMRHIYSRATLGVVNFNWEGSLESFCCTAVEMLASELPVVSFARGALPEVIGQSGGAFLLHSPSLRNAAAQISTLLQHPQKLLDVGKAGREYVLHRYSFDTVMGTWDQLIQNPSGYHTMIDKLKTHSHYARKLSYDLIREVRPHGLNGALNILDGTVRKLRSLRRKSV